MQFTTPILFMTLLVAVGAQSFPGLSCKKTGVYQCHNDYITVCNSANIVEVVGDCLEEGMTCKTINKEPYCVEI